MSSLETPTDPSYTYDYSQFWRFPPKGAYGPWNPEDPDGSDVLNRQLDTILTVLQRSAVNFAKIRQIFEIGCGFGRIARFCAQTFPEAHYTGLDINQKAIASAMRFQPKGDFLWTDFFDLNIKAMWDDLDFRGYDLVIASEVFMHVPPAKVEAFIGRALNLVDPFGGYLLSADWAPTHEDRRRLNQKRRRTGKEPIAPWNFIHDYQELFDTLGQPVASARTDEQKVYLVRP